MAISFSSLKASHLPLIYNVYCISHRLQWNNNQVCGFTLSLNRSQTKVWLCFDDEWVRVGSSIVRLISTFRKNYEWVKLWSEDENSQYWENTWLWGLVIGLHWLAMLSRLSMWRLLCLCTVSLYVSALNAMCPRSRMFKETFKIVELMNTQARFHIFTQTHAQSSCSVHTVTDNWCAKANPFQQTLHFIITNSNTCKLHIYTLTGHFNRYTCSVAC